MKKSLALLVILLIGMILSAGCVDRFERETQIKNNANFPTTGGNVPQGVPVQVRVTTAFQTVVKQVFPQDGGGPTSPTPVPSNDKAKAYQDMLNQITDVPDTYPTISPVTASPTLPIAESGVIVSSANQSVQYQNYPEDNTTTTSKTLLNMLGDYSSFDNGIYSWTAHNGALSADTTHPHDGRGNALFITNDASDNYIEYNISSGIVAAGTQYTLSAWIQGVNPGASYIQVIDRARNGSILGQNNSSNLVSDNRYHRSVLTFTTPIGTDRISIRIHTMNPGTAYIDSLKLELGPKATNYANPVDISRLQHYPDILPLGEVFTYGLTGYERDVSITQYRLKSSFVIGFQGRYGPTTTTVSAPNNMTFLFVYIKTAHNGTVREIPRPFPSDFSVIINNISYSNFTLPQSLIDNFTEFPDQTDPVDIFWRSDNSSDTTGLTVTPTITFDTSGNNPINISYEIHDDLGFVRYEEGYLYPHDEYTGLLIFLVPDDVYSDDTYVSLNIQYLASWFQTPKWQIRTHFNG